MELFYRVKTGYGKDDFIAITEDELPMAMRAQVNGGVAIFNEGTVSGNHIMSILPDYNRVLGLHRDYQLTGEDYRELPADCKNNHMQLIEETKYAQIDTPQLKRLN